MRRVLAMALKDLTLISRDWMGLFFIFGFPVCMGIFFGTIMGSMGGGGSGKVSVAVIDEDDSAMSKMFVESIQKNKKINAKTMPRNQAANQVRRGELVGMIVLQKGFGETAGVMWRDPPAIVLGLDPSRQAETAMLQGFVMQAMGELVGARFTNPGGMRSMIAQSTSEIQSEDVPENMRPLLSTMFSSLDSFLGKLDELQQEQQKAEEAEENNEASEDEAAEGEAADSPFGQMQFARFETIDVTRDVDPNSPAAIQKKLRSRWDISFPQASLWGVLACAACFAATIVREKSRGTLVRLQAAPVTNVHIVAGKALACFIAVMSVLLLMIALGVALGMRPRSWPMLIVASICLSYCFVGVMMLMSIVGRTEEAVAGASWSANMLMAMFGGGMIPLAFLPTFMQKLSNISPVKWGILSLEGAIWRGFSIAEMILPCALLLIVGTVGLAIGTAIIRRRMEQV